MVAMRPESQKMLEEAQTLLCKYLNVLTIYLDKHRKRRSNLLKIGSSIQKYK